MQKIEIGKIYRHYKGNLYKIIGFAKHSETLEDMIVYQPLKTGDNWVRPHKMWNEIVDNKGTLRFTLVEDYIDDNQYLYLYDMAPRTFGQTWGEKHILKLFPQFTKASCQNLKEAYPNFDGEFDLWINGIRVEVKACRANNTKGEGSLTQRAYRYKETLGYKYHFQQLKPSCCDIFIWIGVCKDKLLYWVLTTDELLKTGSLGSQHRNKDTKQGVEVYEGQVFMTEQELKPFQTEEADILKTVLTKGLKTTLK